jgi:drug/metabolite transporter (DMT)-like permease
MLNFSQLRTSTLMGFLAILLWSTTVAFARSISENLGPFTAGASIYLLAGLLLYIARFSNKRTFRNSNIQTSLYIFGCGALFLIYTTSFYIAVNLASSRTQTLEVGLINYLWPGLTILFSLPIFGKKANLWLIPGSLIAFAGVFLALTQ